LVVSAAATGLGFGVSPKVGFALVCLTAVVFTGFIVWTVRQGRRRRAAGERPDLDDVQRRMRKLAKWGIALAILTTITTAISIASDHIQTPTWVLLLGPVFIWIGVAGQCLMAWLILPRLRRKQASESA
jgi:UDP-N-acetylmuramyl pentapeptide phosphotransferase/UDP-N-acetylglucosamine-1-phosphate transferase